MSCRRLNLTWNARVPSASCICICMTAKIMHYDLSVPLSTVFSALGRRNAHTEAYVHYACIKALRGRTLHMCPLPIIEHDGSPL